jgi:hypothetical protein
VLRSTDDRRPYDRTTVSALARRISAEQDLLSTAFDLIERSVEQLPVNSIDEVLASFAMLPAGRVVQ